MKQNMSTAVTWVELGRLGKGVFVRSLFVKESLYIQGLADHVTMETIFYRKTVKLQIQK